MVIRMFKYSYFIILIVFGFSNLGANNVLVFSPHPDDDILGCGGSLVDHKIKGDSVTTVYITSGDAAEWRDIPGKDLAIIRESEAKKASEIIGVTDLVFLRQPDGAVGYSPDQINEVRELFEKYKPNIVYIPHSKDGHKDHQATFVLVTKALKEAIAAMVIEKNSCLVLCYEVWTPLQEISQKNDITSSIDLKLKALSEHVSQTEVINYVEGIKGLNNYRGIMVAPNHYGYAECFQVHNEE